MRSPDVTFKANVYKSHITELCRLYSYFRPYEIKNGYKDEKVNQGLWFGELQSVSVVKKINNCIPIIYNQNY